MRRINDWDSREYNVLFLSDNVYSYDYRVDKGVKLKDRYDELQELSVEDLESEINFYSFLLKNESDLGGIEECHRVWYESLKIEIKRRGLIIDTRVVLIKPWDIMRQ